MIDDGDESRSAPGRDPLEYLEMPASLPAGTCGSPSLWSWPWRVLLAFAFPAKYRSATLILVEPNKVPDYFVTPMTSEGIARQLADDPPGRPEPHPPRAAWSRSSTPTRSSPASPRT